jgi:DNA-binding SARP family transcriptional activator
MAMKFRILGPLEVEDDGRELALGGPKPRALLAVLLLHPNEVVPADRLIDELWGGDSRQSTSLGCARPFRRVC